MIRVVVVDDHAVVRECLRQILAVEADFSIVGEAADGNAALDLMRVTPWDVAILDISMPGKDGLEVLTELKAEMPDKPVLIFTVHHEEDCGHRALQTGAAGYIQKTADVSEFVEALRRSLLAVVT